MLLPRRSGAVVSAVALTVALLASVLLATPSASAATSGRVRGAVYGANGVPSLVVQWFTRDWKYLGKRKVSNGIYSLSLPAGTYRLQFVDQRPAYNLKKYAPADVLVTVRAGATTTKSVRMRRGAAIYGVARAGGKVAKGARIVAANTYQQSYPVVANAKGQFAIGGLPTSKYSLFTYDRKKRFVGKSVYVGRLKAGKAKAVNPRLTVRAGRLLVDLYAGGAPLRSRVNATVTSLATGQWWSANSSGGSVSFGGVYPGRYKITVPGVGVWFGRSGNVSGGKVRAGRVGFGSFALTNRGGWVTGRIVDASAPTSPLRPTDGSVGATVQLKDGAGRVLASAVTTSSGTFVVSGQLASQSGLTLTITPTPNTGGYMLGGARCHYEPLPVPNVSIRMNQGTPLGDLKVARTPDQGEQCKVAAPVS